jgi:hypothetical protein
MTAVEAYTDSVVQGSKTRNRLGVMGHVCTAPALQEESDY